MNQKYWVKRWSGSTPPDANEIRTEMVNEGFYVFLWTDPSGAVHAPHEHATDQSHWIISGAIELDVEGFGTLTFRAGDRDFMPAHTKHSARVIGDEPVVYLIGEKA